MTIELTLPDMTCGHCVKTVTATAQRLDPAALVKADLSTHRVTIDSAGRLWIADSYNNRVLEYDTPRAGDFQPLRFVPKSKGVVLGLVSTKTAALEDPAELRRRIDAAAEVIDLDRLGIGPQCGFASTVAGNPVTASDQAAKLGLCVTTARTVWGSA